MKKVAIITDSNSGMSQKEAQELGVYVIPMPFVVDGEEYFEDVNLTQDEFHKRLAADAEISTSQPAIGQIVELWGKLLQEYEGIVHIPMSSALSQSCETATMFAKNYGGRVCVVDNHRISVTQKFSVYDAIALAKQGKSAQEIKDYLLESAAESSIYIMVDTLKYLKKGGRITPAAALIGTLLNIKPVLQIQGGKLDRFAKVVNIKQAKTRMISAIKEDIEGRFSTLRKNKNMYLAIAYTNCRDKAVEFAKEAEEALNMKVKLIDPLSLSVSCHIGSGALAIACATTVGEL